MSRIRGSNAQKRKYRCKYCNDENTVYHPVASELKCKSCGSIIRVSSKDLDKLRIIQTGKKRRDTSGMSKIERMKAMTHMQDRFQEDLSGCGIQKSGKFSNITLTENADEVTCKKCQWNT